MIQGTIRFQYPVYVVVLSYSSVCDLFPTTDCMIYGTLAIRFIC